jgi:DNA adenine methylase
MIVRLAAQLTTSSDEERLVQPFRSQLLKWIGNKQRFAPEIIAHFPTRFGTYYEPFLGAGGILGTLAPANAVASDAFRPLIEIWRTLSIEPDTLKTWYAERWETACSFGDKVAGYERTRARYNASPNGADLLFLCRACYGGVVRFRQRDGYMSTPCGAHTPISPAAFAARVDEWSRRTRGTRFECRDFTETMREAQQGDLIYCDPPYSESQTILYGAQAFSLARLLAEIRACKERGVFVALSIDGVKAGKVSRLPLPADLFEREIFIRGGGSMLRRFQVGGGSVADHLVADRLLLTF